VRNSRGRGTCDTRLAPLEAISEQFHTYHQITNLVLNDALYPCIDGRGDPGVVGANLLFLRGANSALLDDCEGGQLERKILAK